MRFRFCGDLDCPDWVLAEINTLSKMSSVKVKILCQIVAKTLTGNEFDEEKAKKLVLDAKLDVGDMKACVSALSLIFVSSARYAVEEEVLNNELQQLGLPKEHAIALCKVYSEHLTALTEDLRKSSMRTSILEDVSCTVRDLESQKIELNLRINDKIRNVTSCDVITMTSEQLSLLLAGVKSSSGKLLLVPSSIPCYETFEPVNTFTQIQRSSGKRANNVDCPFERGAVHQNYWRDHPRVSPFEESCEGCCSRPRSRLSKSSVYQDSVLSGYSNLNSNLHSVL